VIAIVVALVVASLSLFTVDQRQNAIVFRLGEIVSVKNRAGTVFKVPLVDNVAVFRFPHPHARLPRRRRSRHVENKPVLGFVVKWRIVERQAILRQRAGATKNLARVRLTQASTAACGEEFGKRTIHEVVSGEREKIMDLIARKGGSDRARNRCQVLDVAPEAGRPSRPRSAKSVYGRMAAERQARGQRIAVDRLCGGGENPR